MLFIFDNSSGHSAFAANALVATRMNLGPGTCSSPLWGVVHSLITSHVGGKNTPFMRDGWLYRLDAAGRKIPIIGGREGEFEKDSFPMVEKGVPRGASAFMSIGSLLTLHCTGIKSTLLARGLWRAGLKGVCTKAKGVLGPACKDAGDCCARKFGFRFPASRTVVCTVFLN